MKCAVNYKGGSLLSDKDIPTLKDRLKIKVPKYKKLSDKELTAIAVEAIKNNNIGFTIASKFHEIFGSNVVYTDANGNTKSGTIDTVKVTKKDNNYNIKISLANGEILEAISDMNFKNTVINNGDITSNSISTVISRLDYKGNNILYNRTIDEKEFDRLFSNAKIEDNIHNLFKELADIDSKRPNSYYDSKHVEYLSNFIKELYANSSKVANLKIKVSKEIADTLKESIGEFDPNNKTTPIRILVANMKQRMRNRFIMSNTETLAHETLHAAMDPIFRYNRDIKTQDIKTDIRRLYAVAKKNLTFESFLPDSPTEDEITKAKEMYDYIFKGKSKDFSIIDSNVRLQEFIAYGTTNKYFNRALNGLTVEVKGKKKKKGIDGIVESILSYISNMLNKTRKESREDVVGKELVRLTFELTTSYETHKSKVRSGSKPMIDKVADTVGKSIDNVNTIAKKPIDKLLAKAGIDTKEKYTNKDVLSKLKELTTIMKGFDNKGKLAQVLVLSKALPLLRLIYIASDNASIRPDVYANYSKLLYQIDNAGFKFIRELTSDFTAGRKTLEQVTDMAMQFNSHIDRMRESMYQGTLVDIKEAFKKFPIFRKKNRRYHIALNKSILRPDIQAVTTDAKELKTYLEDSSKVSKKIIELEKELIKEAGNNANTMIEESKSLSNYMINKRGLRTNIHNIARRFGEPDAIPLYVDVSTRYNIKAVEDILDSLTSLYALERVDKTEKEYVIRLIDKDPEGVSHFLYMAKGAQNATKEDWKTSGSLHLMAKGQLKESSDNSKDLIMARKEDYAKLKALGYTKVRKVIKDFNDRDTTEYWLYHSVNTGLSKRISGTIGLQRISVKGLLLSDKIRLSNKGLSTKAVLTKLSKEINYLRGKKTTTMSPVYDSDGNIVDYRYEYTLADEEQYLDLEKRGTELLARTFGQKNTQEMNDDLNKKVIDIIFKDYDKIMLQKSNKFAKKFDVSHMYMRIHSSDYKLLTKTEKAMGKEALAIESKLDLTDRPIGEILWGLLPPDARAYVVEKNREIDEASGLDSALIKDRKELYVRKDLLTQLFGYSDSSITDSALLSKLPTSTKYSVKRAEGYWADFMQIAKNMVVIKLPATFIGNILSNAKFLWFSGVPPKKATELLLMSKRSLEKWKEDEKKLFKLERMLDSETSEAKKAMLKKDIKDMEAELADNPLKPLMDRGLYQTIVEDVDMLDSNNKIVQKAEDMLSNIVGNNTSIENLINTIVLSRKSVLGQSIAKITQEGDFHFRAALYWYGKENNVNEEKLMRDITDNFINYSKVINSRTVQWLDKMGPEAFWKYFANVQRVVLKLIRNKSGRVLADIAGEEYLGFPNDVLNSSIFTQWERRLNPLNFVDNVTGLVDGATEVPILNIVEGF